MVNLRDAELELYTRVIGQLHRLTNDRTTAEGEIEKLTQEVKEQRLDNCHYSLSMASYTCLQGDCGGKRKAPRG